jgi:chromate transporter
MEHEVVHRRSWMTREQFLDLLGAAHLIPGPNSTELAIHIGRLRGGWPGLLIAGAGFILPATLIVTAIAWAYVRFGALPPAHGLLYGIKPVVIAVVAQALWRLGGTALRSLTTRTIAVAAAIAVVFGAHELLVLAFAAAAGALIHLKPRALAHLLLASIAGQPFVAAAQGAAGTAPHVPFTLLHLFGVFVKVGSVLFGSGYVLLAFLRADLVERLGWMTEAQLLDAVAVGQVTPGPVFTTATFVGYLLGGVPGAAIATIGIFLPAFVFVALSAPILPRIRQSSIAGGALDGVNAASLALMAVVSWQLGRAAIVDPLTIVLAGICVLILLFRPVNPAWLILAGGVAGIIAH